MHFAPAEVQAGVLCSCIFPTLPVSAQVGAFQAHTPLLCANWCAVPPSQLPLKNKKTWIPVYRHGIGPPPLASRHLYPDLMRHHTIRLKSTPTCARTHAPPGTPSSTNSTDTDLGHSVTGCHSLSLCFRNCAQLCGRACHQQYYAVMHAMCVVSI